MITYQIQRLLSAPQTLQNSSKSSAPAAPLALPTTHAWEYLQTGQLLSFHLLRQAQWKTCWHRIVSSPVVSSIRSKQTGHVGSSSKEGVGGGAGFVEIAVAGVKDPPAEGIITGENGSLSKFPGKFSDRCDFKLVEDINWIDLMNTTWQFSGFKFVQ